MTGILTKKQYRASSSKWRKTILLRRKKSLRRFIPPTRLYSGKALTAMLAQYRLVYVKPLRGSHGDGIMRIERIGSRYLLHHGTAIKRGLTLEKLLRVVRKRTGRRPYLMQRGIAMLRHRGRIFDLRVVAQLDRSRSWQITGMLARVAKQGRAVTNGAQGASIHPVDSVLAAYAGSASRARTRATLHRFCLSAALELRRNFPFLTELGFDIALDSKLHPWVLEVNVRPEAIPFTRLPDKTMYRRILRYRRINRRG
ncbi:YheC/YheD family protein [Paenibacillus sp. NPDC058174]|uniref:YheC/YheD family protein n=1 Tax=Paenibacillus sp. NPDC058174 TaxID=3346366 RepID=UPI0036DBC469